MSRVPQLTLLGGVRRLNTALTDPFSGVNAEQVGAFDFRIQNDGFCRHELRGGPEF